MDDQIIEAEMNNAVSPFAWILGAQVDPEMTLMAANCKTSEVHLLVDDE
jgi:hypothetical protein